MQDPVSFSIRRGISLQLFSTVDNIPENNWKNITSNSSVFLSLDYLKGLELSRQEGYQFVYGLVLKDDVPFAAIYFQAIDLATIKIGAVIHAEPYGKFLKLVSDKITHSLIRPSKGGIKWLLINGNMNASGEYGIACNTNNHSGLAKVFPDILNKVSNYLDNIGEVSVYIVKDFHFENDFLFSVLKEERFIRFVMDPVMVIDINPEWKKIDDYLRALSSKYRLRASTVIEKVAAFDIRELNCNTIKKYSTMLDRLYQAVIGKSPVRIVHPDINYIYQLKEQLAEKFIVKCWFSKDEPIAFYTYLLSDEEVEAHHIGLNYHLNKTYALYQNILYSLIADTIKHKLGRLNFGRTAMEMKSTVGAVPENHAAYIKLNSKVLNHLLKPFLPSQPPVNWVQRDPFRKA